MWNVILLKNDEAIDVLTSLPTDFSALKYVQAEMLFNFQLAAGQLSRFHHKGPVASWSNLETSLLLLKIQTFIIVCSVVFILAW